MSTLYEVEAGEDDDVADIWNIGREREAAVDDTMVEECQKQELGWGP